MEFDIKTGRLKNATFLASPHCDERPSLSIDAIVIHNISLPPGQFGTGAIQRFFCGTLDFATHPYFLTIQSLKVSSHVLITREGEVIQFVPFTKRAWHAGQSSLFGREQWNDFSIGIELEGTDELPFEEAQYAALSQLVKVLMKAFPAIERKYIVGHSDIAPNRKTDPGPFFDWAYFDCLMER